MKIKTLAIVVLSALSLSSAAALADTTTVNGGTIHFKGEVVNAACAVDAGSVDQTVQLGQVRTASLKQAGFYGPYFAVRDMVQRGNHASCARLTDIS